MTKGKIAVGAILGALVGIAAGVLTAPRSGKETRTDLKTKAGNLKRSASDKLDAGREKTAEAIERLQGAKDRG